MRSGPVPDINQEEKLKGVKSVYTLLSISSITPCRIIRCPNIQGQVCKKRIMLHFKYHLQQKNN